MAASLSPAKKKEDFKEEFLTCSICSEPYDNDKHKAKCLPCLHTYCKSCLESIAGKRPQLDCSNCRKLIRLPGGTVDTLPNNFLVENLKDYQDLFNASIFCSSCKKGHAVSFCQDCSAFLCQKCEEAHSQLPLLNHHKLLTMAQLQENKHNPISQQHQHCTKHPKQDLTMYCQETNCKVPVCATCGLVDHRGHELIESSAALAEIIDDMQQSVAEVDKRNHELGSMRSEQERPQGALTTSFKKKQEEMQKFVEKLKREIDASHTKATSHLKGLYEAELANVSSSLDSMNTLSAQMSSATDFANQSCDRNHPAQLLTSQRQIMERLNELKTVKLPSTASDKTEFDFTVEHDKAMTEIQKALQVFCSVGFVTCIDQRKCTIQLDIFINNLFQRKAIVTTVDCNGQKMTTGGIKVQATDTICGLCALEVTDHKDGTYLFTYLLYDTYISKLNEEDNALYVTINGIEMKGNPFKR